MNEIRNIKKSDSIFLDEIFTYMNRTIAVRMIVNPQDLEATWEDTQFELGSRYQYEGVNAHVWDYYLVFCCDFSEEDLDKRLRFKIESDRFCCRKYFEFGIPRRSFNIGKLIKRLFPIVKATKPIQMIKAETIQRNLGEDLSGLVPTSFFTENVNEASIETLIESLIAKRKPANG